jgi:hypothetical protein
LGSACDAVFLGLTTITNATGTSSGRLLKDNVDDASNCNNSSRIRWVISYASPLVVIEQSNFDLAFRITNGFTIELAESSGVDYVVTPGVNPHEVVLSTY